ncbi:LysR family transcriptional regulator [Cupriavidus necator]
MKTNLSLKQMEALLAIADEGNFSAAAAYLCVSQPALSRTVRLAEEALGTRIFDRDTRTVRVTPAGEELLPIARRILAEFTSSMGELGEFIEGRRGRVRVASVPSLAHTLLLRAVSRNHADHPGVDLVLRVDTADQILAALERRDIDVGLSVQPPPAGGFSYRHLHDDHFVLVCREDDELASRAQPLDWSVFASRPFISVTTGSNTRSATDSAFMKAGLAIQPAYEVASISLPLISGLIAEGLGVSALPASAMSCLTQPGLVACALKPLVKRRVGIVTVSGRTLSVATQHFCKHVEVLAREMV